MISDFLINTSVSHDKYQTPAEIEGTLKDKPSGGGLKQEEKVDSDNEKADCILSEYESSEEKELVIAEDTDEDNHAWDCETIVTTFSNLDNHPGKIYASDKGSTRTVASRVEVNKSVIRLYGKQQIPTDYLPRQKPDKGKSCDDNKKSLEAQEVKPCGRRQRILTCLQGRRRSGHSHSHSWSSRTERVEEQNRTLGFQKFWICP